MTNEEKIISMYSLRRPMAWMMKETGWSRKKITQFLKDKDLWTGHKSLMHYLDEFYFDNIDTEEKAYWLGFLFADGYLSNSKNEIGVELADRDREHLEKFRKAIKTEIQVKIYHKNSTFGLQDNARLIFSNKHMRTILLNWFGGNVNKTRYGIFPKITDNNLIRHLIRGYFDGNGSISLREGATSILTPSIGICGQKNSLEYIENFSGFKWNWSKRHPEKDDNNFQIGCGRVKDVLSFLHYIYDDATVFLNRKYDKAITLFENRASNES